MPYLIITTYENDPTAEFLPGAEPVQSRRAVATLDEVRKECYREIRDDQSCQGVERARLTLAVEHLTDLGGTVGPLPDGTVIEVEQVGWSEIGEAVGYVVHGEASMEHNEIHDLLIAAYNAAQEKREER